MGMVYGAQWHGFMDHNGILWFLPCLFMTEVLFFAVKKLSKPWLQLLVVLLLACAGFSFQTNLPWCINIACVALQFFFVGNVFRVLLLKTTEEKQEIIPAMSVFIVAFASYILLSAHWANHVNMATNEYGNIVIFEVLAFLGVIGFVYAFKTLSYFSFNGGGILVETLWLSLLYTSSSYVLSGLSEKRYTHHSLLRPICGTHYQLMWL